MPYTDSCHYDDGGDCDCIDNCCYNDDDFLIATYVILNKNIQTIMLSIEITEHFFFKS